jgi:hypothetical protein
MHGLGSSSVATDNPPQAEQHNQKNLHSHFLSAQFGYVRLFVLSVITIEKITYIEI